MSILSKLTITPLLYAVGALLILSGVLGFNLKLANADKAAAVSARAAAATERDAWKAKTIDAQSANDAFAAIIDKQQRIAEEQRAAAAAAALLASEQVDKAQAEAAKAKTERDTFRRKFNAKPKDCTAALDAMQAACPTLDGF